MTGWAGRHVTGLPSYPPRVIRTSRLLAVAALTVSLCACSGGDTEAELTRSTAGPPATTEPPSRFTLLQRPVGEAPKIRILDVEPDGAWSCDNCAGDGQTSNGRLSTTQNDELRRLLDGAAFREEAERARRYRLTCTDALVHTLRLGMSAITTADCPGEQRPPVTGAILRLLADATPVEVAP